MNFQSVAPDDFWVSPLQLVRVKKKFQIFSIFSPNYVILRHLEKKKIFSKNFPKTLFGNFDHEAGRKTFLLIYAKL